MKPSFAMVLRTIVMGPGAFSPALAANCETVLVYSMG